MAFYLLAFIQEWAETSFCSWAGYEKLDAGRFASSALHPLQDGEVLALQHHASNPQPGIQSRARALVVFLQLLSTVGFVQRVPQYKSR